MARDRSHIPLWKATAIVTRKAPPLLGRKTFWIRGYSLDNVMNKIHRDPRVKEIISVVLAGGGVAS